MTEVERLRAVLEELNELRSNVVRTQSATWSNAFYPLVAILDAAGFELEDRTVEQCADHMAAYGGAGHTPRNPKPGNRMADAQIKNIMKPTDSMFERRAVATSQPGEQS